MDVILDFSAADTPLSFFVWSFGAELDGEFPAFACDVELADKSWGTVLNFARENRSGLRFDMRVEFEFDAAGPQFEFLSMLTPGMGMDASVSEFILEAQLSPVLVFDGYATEFLFDSDVVEYEPLQFDIDLDGEIPHFALDAIISPDLVLDTGMASFVLSTELAMPIHLDTTFSPLDPDISVLSGFYSTINVDGLFDSISGNGFYSGDGWSAPNADFSLLLVYSPNGITPPAEDRDYIPTPASGPHSNLFVSVPFGPIVSDIHISLYMRAINIPSLCETWLTDPNDAHIHSGSGVVKKI